MALTQVQPGMLGATQPYNFKNRIINGAMVIDQRNAGASFTPANAVCGLDRFVYGLSQASKITSQQNQGSVTAPVGFVNYLGTTSSSAYSVTSGDVFLVGQHIEGYNISDLGWGTANAKTVTLSFWVRSSLTGTFAGSLNNNANDRSYPYTYTISSANTWEQKSITIVGDTTGTWLTTNGVGLRVYLSLGAGSTYNGTAGAWASGTYFSVSGATSVVGTSGATFYITGVQLELGVTATSFDYRAYGQELALCQRYYFKTNDASSATGANGAPIVGIGSSTNGCIVCGFRFPVQMRTTPTWAFTSFNGTSGVWSNSANNNDTASATVNGSAASGLQQVIVSGLTTGQPYYVYGTASAEL